MSGVIHDQRAVSDVDAYHATRASPHRLSRKVALLTAGRDRPYALGLAGALISAGVSFDFIGSDMVDSPELHDNPLVRVLKLRDQQLNATIGAKVLRVLTYYSRLIAYSASAEPTLFHILWNNKFEIFDRTVLMWFYKLLGKKLVLTVHNVNAGERDSIDSWANRASLRLQYRSSDHIFVHTEKMKGQVVAEFGVPASKVSVIPFGINNSVPTTDLSTLEAKRRLGVGAQSKTLLFFGNIAPYKGLDCLVSAFIEGARQDQSYRLIIAGRPKGSRDYWERIHQVIVDSGLNDRIIQRVEYIPDEETELYFKAADVLILPYQYVFQSGVLFLAYNFGLPVIAADVGSLKEEIVEGETGFVFKSQDPANLANAIRRYFGSELFKALETRRPLIREYAHERYSWSKVSAMTIATYSNLLKDSPVNGLPASDKGGQFLDDGGAVCGLGKYKE